MLFQETVYIIWLYSRTSKEMKVLYFMSLSDCKMGTTVEFLSRLCGKKSK